MLSFQLHIAHMCVPVYVFLKVTEWLFFFKTLEALWDPFVYTFKYWNKSSEIINVVKTPVKVIIV